MAGASVKVAVRARPLNKREIDMGAEMILSMSNQDVTVVNKKVKREHSIESHTFKNPFHQKQFSFDHAYWSASESDSHFTKQEQIYDDLGVDVVNSALLGYNACIFAYGQTGAGKTFTMMGSDKKPGLIPRICENLFAKFDRNSNTSYRVETSYIEIYNEQVRDLLRKNPSPMKRQDSLKVREHPKEGPFVQGVTVYPVTEFPQMQQLMESGNSVRATAATMMNDTSSRSHAIFTVKFTQAKFSGNVPSETASKIHLVDLAGSERASASGATGQRLKEGGSINRSLSTLGLVISTLAENSTCSGENKGSNKRPVFVPYRDSVLTWLLKDSLGGNSRTIMIAAVSPADVNYEETLSTLRYASRAMKIVNKPVINEDPNVKLIRELRAEIKRLRAMIQSGTEKNLTRRFSEAIEAKLAEEEHKADELLQTWKYKWEQTQVICQEEQLTMKKQGRQTLLISEKPHFVGIDVDPLSAEIVIYQLEEGITMIGSKDLTEEQVIALHGSGIEKEHCRIEVANRAKVVFLRPVSSKCYVNGLPVNEEHQLTQGDVVQFGDCLKFRFNNPKEAALLLEKRRSGNFSAEFSFNFSQDRSLDSGLSCPDELEICESPDLNRTIENDHMLKVPEIVIGESMMKNPMISEADTQTSPLHSPVCRKKATFSNANEEKRSSLSLRERRLSTPIRLPARELDFSASPIEWERRHKSMMNITDEKRKSPVVRSHSFNKKDFDEQRELVRGLMNKYRNKEVNRIEKDRQFRTVFGKEIEVLKKKRKKLEEQRKNQEGKFNEAKTELETCRQGAETEKEEKKRAVEKKIDQIIESLRKKGPKSIETERELRKKKFQIRSKVEEFWKRMDLYENCLLGIELDRRGHSGFDRNDMKEEVKMEDNLTRPGDDSIAVHNKDVNVILEQKQVLEELLRRHSEALTVNETKLENVKVKVEECKDKYAERLTQSNSLLEELERHWTLTSELLENETAFQQPLQEDKPQVVHTLKYVNSVSSPLHIEREEWKAGENETIYEFPEDIFEDESTGSNEDNAAGSANILNKFEKTQGVKNDDINTDIKQIEERNGHSQLTKTQSKGDKLLIRKNKYESLIKEAQRSIVELKSARTLEIDQYNNEATEAHELCTKIKQRIENDEARLASLHEELNTRSMKVSNLENTEWAGTTTNLNSIEHQKLQLLQSRAKVVELFEQSLQSTLNDSNLELKEMNRNSWGGFRLNRSRNYVSMKDMVDSVMQSVHVDNLDEIAEKEAKLATYRKEITEMEMKLKDIDEKEASLQTDVFQQLENRKLRSEMSRFKHYEEISRSVEQLLTIAEGKDPNKVTEHLSKEAQFLAKCRERVECLEESMFTKVKESKELQLKMRQAHERLKSASSEFDDFDDALDCKIELEIEELEFQKEECEQDIDDLQKRLEDERKQYLDILKCQDDYVIIGKEYREARQIMMKVLGNQAAADVQKEVFWASNAIDLIEQGIDPTDSPVAGGWRPFTKEKDVTILRKPVSKTGVQSFVGCGIIKTPPHVVWESVRNPLSRFIYDSLLKKINVIEHVDDNLKVVYMRHEGRVCVMKHIRDFCTIHCERNQSDMMIAASQSVEHPHCPEIPNIFRAKLLPSGWVVEPYYEGDQEWSMVWYIVKVFANLY